MTFQEKVTLGHNPVLHPYGAGASLPDATHPQRNNDDYLVSYDTQTYAVFDGVGNMSGAQEASHTAVRQFYEEYTAQPQIISSKQLAIGGMRRALKRAHNAINDYVLNGATTAAAAHLFEDERGKPHAVIGHSGDSRAYLLRGGSELRHLTLDNAASPEDALYVPSQHAWDSQNRLSNLTSFTGADDITRSRFMNRNIISAHLGDDLGQTPRAHVGAFALIENDRLLLTTDGIHDNLTTNEIEDVLRSEYDPTSAANELIAASQERSRSGHLRAKHDDMTAVVVNVPRLG